MTPRISDAARVALFEREADFAMAEIAPVIAAHAPKADLRCLEIGCGLGLLMGRLQTQFPSFHFEGIEPIAVAAGFGRTEHAAQLVAEDARFAIHRCAYEDFRSDQAFDVIFSINVAEHVASWQHYLSRTFELLAPGGVSIMLCPNYAFPWESHFQMPIIGGKAMTERLLGGFIAAFEAREECPGLWQGLNFIRKRDVTRFLRAHAIPFQWDEAIMGRMLGRLFTDADFARRHARFSPLARLLYRSGAAEIIRIPPLSWFAPYLKLIVTKPERRDPDRPLASTDVGGLGRNKRKAPAVLS